MSNPMNNVYNISTVSAGRVIELLTDLYLSAIENHMLPAIPSVALWGPMGVGKSTAVRAIAENLTRETGQTVKVVDIRLLNFTPVDLRGIPTTDADKKLAIWLKPKIFDLPEDEISILFLDEISAAPQSLQAAAYQIALDKQIGEHRLPENCIVICAGNRTTDRSVAFRMPKALANRLMHFEIQASFSSWYTWAVNRGVDEKVLGYLSFDSSRLIQEPDVEELAFPTPRSWEFVSRLLRTNGKTPRELHELIAGCIGESTAVSFEAWCQIYRTLPSVDDIIAGRCRLQEKSVDALYALSSSLIFRVASCDDELTDQELENVCRYASGFPADFASMFFRSLLKIEGMNMKLAKIPAFTEWMKRNRKLL